MVASRRWSPVRSRRSRRARRRFRSLRWRVPPASTLLPWAGSLAGPPQANAHHAVVAEAIGRQLTWEGALSVLGVAVVKAARGIALAGKREHPRRGELSATGRGSRPRGRSAGRRIARCRGRGVARRWRSLRRIAGRRIAGRISTIGRSRRRGGRLRGGAATAGNDGEKRDR